MPDFDFSYVHRSYFKADTGAFSEVTADEHDNSQITLTDREKKVAVEHFGEANIHRGSVKLDPQQSEKTFRVWGKGTTANLKLNFPKEEKPELRLYLSEDEFKPPTGDIWFIFRRGGEIWIGHLGKDEWASIHLPHEQRVKVFRDTEEEDDFNEELDASEKTHKEKKKAKKPKKTKSKTGVSYARDADVSWTRLNRANHQCEIDAGHETFISQTRGKQFVEPHHIVPMSRQGDYDVVLDSIENIVALCPNCHRAVHYAAIEHRMELLEKLLELRSELTKELGIDEEVIRGFYA